MQLPVSLPFRVNARGVLNLTAAFAAGGLFAVLAFLPASTPADKAPAQPSSTQTSAKSDCERQTWPYVDHGCAEQRQAAEKQKLRQVRIVSTDSTQPPRVVNAPEPEAAQPPKAEPQPAKADAQPATAAAAQPQSAPPAPYGQMSAAERAAAWTMAIGPAKSATPAPAAPPQPAPQPASVAAPPQPPVATPQRAAPPIQMHSEPPVGTAVKPAKRERKTYVADRSDRSSDRPAFRERSDEPRTLIRTYDYADGRRVTVYHRLKPGEDPRSAFAAEEPPPPPSRGMRTIRLSEEAGD